MGWVGGGREMETQTIPVWQMPWKPVSLFVLQPLWPAIRRTWSEVANTARVHGGTSNCGSLRNQAWTRSCTGWMKTWLPPPTASTKSLSETWRACPPILPTPSLCTSCPALTLWLVSPFLFPSLSRERKKEATFDWGAKNKVIYNQMAMPYTHFLFPAKQGWTAGVQSH